MLSTINLHLSRIVFVAAGIFAVLLTAIAALSGNPLYLVGTTFGVTTAAYTVQVARRPRLETARVHSIRTRATEAA